METQLDTSIYILKSLHLELKKIAKTMNISQKNLIIMLFDQYIMNKKVNVKTTQLVKYQNKLGKEYYHTFHISMPHRLYEFLTDLRKIEKKTVSLLLLEAAKKYLKKIYRKLLKIKKVKKNISKKTLNVLFIFNKMDYQIKFFEKQNIKKIIFYWKNDFDTKPS